MSTSAGEALAGLLVEDVQVRGLRVDEDLGALLRDLTAVDAGDEGLGERVVAAALDGDALVGRRAIDVGVRAELLDDVDDELETVGVRGDLDVLGTDADDDLAARTGDVTAGGRELILDLRCFA